MQICYSDTELICGCQGGYAESGSKKKDYNGVWGNS